MPTYMLQFYIDHPSNIHHNDSFHEHHHYHTCEHHHDYTCEHHQYHENIAAAWVCAVHCHILFLIVAIYQWIITFRFRCNQFSLQLIQSCIFCYPVGMLIAQPQDYSDMVHHDLDGYYAFQRFSFYRCSLIYLYGSTCSGLFNLTSRQLLILIFKMQSSSLIFHNGHGISHRCLPPFCLGHIT